MCKYLIIGASSFIGRHLYNCCRRNRIEIIGTYYKHPLDREWIPFDMCTDHLQSLCNRYLQGKIPETVMICSASTGIDRCKRDAGESSRLNVVHTKKLLKEADDLGIKCVFLSSEAVFDGKKGMYTEEDAPAPVTVYGQQKLEIEQYIAQNIKDYIIFRISRASGSQFGEKDIFDDFYNKIQRQEEIVCLKDQSFCLTEVDDIANAILKALDMQVKGLYHLSSSNYISRYRLAKLYADKIFGGYENIVEKEYGAFSFLDNRHIYCGLNGDRLAGMLNIRFQSIDGILDHYSQTYIRGGKKGHAYSVEQSIQ